MVAGGQAGNLLEFPKNGGRPGTLAGAGPEMV